MKITSLTMHIAQNVMGKYYSTVISGHIPVTLTFDEKGHGVWINGKTCNKLVPWSNIQGVDCAVPVEAAKVEIKQKEVKA